MTQTAEPLGDKIKITPEMIDAGSTVLASYDQPYDRLDETVLRILEAIFGGRLSLQPSTLARPEEL